VSDWWNNDIDNLICSCFECNAGKWNNTSKEIKNLYKVKEEEEKNRVKNLFQDKWNELWLWLIDKNTYILLMRLIWEDIKDWIADSIAFYAYSEDKNEEFVLIEYKIWWDLCNTIVKDSYYINWNFPFDWDDWFLFDEINADKWRWKCKENYSNRLNYELTRNLMDRVPFSFLMKFSYFYNEIKNEQN